LVSHPGLDSSEGINGRVVVWVTPPDYIMVCWKYLEGNDQGYCLARTFSEPQT
jgi:hypothetical protein